MDNELFNPNEFLAVGDYMWDKSISDKENVLALIVAINDEYDIGEKCIHKIAGIISSMGMGLRTIQILSVLGKSVVLTSGLGAGISILTSVAALFTIAEAYGQSEKAFVMRGFAYAFTSWAYNDQKPEPSQEFLNHYKISKGVKYLDDLKAAWQKVVNTTYQAIDKEIVQPHANLVDVIKKIIQEISENDPALFSLMVMSDMENGLDGTFLEVWKANYEIQYPH